MFSVYGLSGPVFHGTLENLARFPPVARGQPVRAPRMLGDSEKSDVSAAKTDAFAPHAETKAYEAMLPKNLDRGPLIHAGQIMQPDIITARADDEAAHAWGMLVRYRIHQAPVLDSAHRLVGVVSSRNLLTAFNIEGGKIRDALSKRVSDVMTTPVVAAASSTDIRHIARVMLEYGVDGVPITSEHGALIGFISRSDILNAVVADPPLSLWR